MAYPQRNSGIPGHYLASLIPAHRRLHTQLPGSSVFASVMRCGGEHSDLGQDTNQQLPSGLHHCIANKPPYSPSSSRADRPALRLAPESYVGAQCQTLTRAADRGEMMSRSSGLVNELPWAATSAGQKSSRPSAVNKGAGSWNSQCLVHTPSTWRRDTGAARRP